jgi:ABC-type nitrate/sulfonate/bicarbonate transport system substrate-binding protein
MTRPTLVAALLLLAGLAGCKKEASAPAPAAPAPRAVHVILDYLPNAAHIGFYQADVAGYYARENLRVHIDAPTSSSDTLRLMAAGQAEFGIVSLLDFVNVRQKGEPLKIIMAVEERPLAALISLEKTGIRRPRDLEGRLVGVTGVISDDAGVRWMIQHDGGDPEKAKLINIGFNTAQEVIAGNVAAAFGFWSQEGVQVAARAPARVLRLYEFGAPPYPELIMFAREDYLAREPDTVRRFVRATVQGYRDALSKPDVALAAMAARVEGETVDGLRPFLAALSPVIKADAPDCGTVNLKVLADYLAWVRQTGVIDYKADPATFATNEFLPPPPGAAP